MIQYVVLSETREILVRLPRHNAPQLVAGQPVWCSWPPELVQLFPHDHAELVRSADPMDEIVRSDLNTHKPGVPMARNNDRPRIPIPRHSAERLPQR